MGALGLKERLLKKMFEKESVRGEGTEKEGGQNI